MSTAADASDLEATRAREEPLILERHGIDYIPPDERHGKPRTLFTFWAASNVQILAISVGALAIVFGLSLPWAIFTIVVGNAAGGLYMALHSVQGPRLGLPQMMQSRAQFGMYGTALPNIIVVLMYIGYFTSSAILGGPTTTWSSVESTTYPSCSRCTASTGRTTGSRCSCTR